MQQTTCHAMGCQIQALIEADTAKARRALDDLPGWFEEWEQALSRFRPASELSCLNAAPGPPVRVSPVLWEVLAVARAAAESSGGLVTPTLLGALEAAGYDQTFEALPPSAPAAPAAETLPAFALDESVVVDAAARTVQLLHGVRLDFGGVAKGWAADQAAQRLGAFGPALVDAGGDIAVSGPRPGGGAWQIGVANPLAPEVDLAQLWLSEGGVATSGRDYRRWQRGGVWQHHLLDPRTRRPAQTDVLSVTMLAPSTVEAEVAAKVALILGSVDGLAWLAARPALTGVLVLEDGRVLHALPLSSAPATNDDLSLTADAGALRRTGL